VNGDANLVIVLLSGAVVLEHLLGVDLLVALTKKVDVALKLAMAVMVSAVVTVLLGHGLDALLGAAGAGWLRIPMLTYAALGGVMASALVTKIVHPRLFVSLRTYFPVLTVNALMLGILLGSTPRRPIAEAVLHGLALAGGFSILAVVFGYLSQRLATSEVPRAFRGAPIMLVTLGILALGFQGFKA